jgi:hypothetical protein
MRLFKPMLAAMLAMAMAMPALAQQQQPPPNKKPPVIINDPSVYRPPPVPHERTYPQGPSTAPPMDRIPQVQPLDRPPIR